MRNYPTDDYDRAELVRLNAAPWMVDLLKCNPAYCAWGPYEDYMWRPGWDEPDATNPRRENYGWESRILVPTWADFELELNDLNEIVNFYFSVVRDSEECAECDATGYHPDALVVSKSFYWHSSPFVAETRDMRETSDLLRAFTHEAPDPAALRVPGPTFRLRIGRLCSLYGEPFRQFADDMLRHGCWHNRITQDEVDALVEAGRLWDWDAESRQWRRPDPVPTAAAVNDREGAGASLDVHDALNRAILVEQRLKRLGIPKTCPTCAGHGSAFTEPAAHVSLTLWVIHPRKGCSRGVAIERLGEADVPAAKAFLRRAAARNAERFQGIQE